MKEVYCYQEVESDLAQGETVAFTVHPTLLVRAAKKNLESEVIIVTYELCIGSDSIGIFTSEFPRQMPQASGIVRRVIGILFCTRVYAFSPARFPCLFRTSHYVRRTSFSPDRSCCAERREYNRAFSCPRSAVPYTPANRTDV